MLYCKIAEIILIKFIFFKRGKIKAGDKASETRDTDFSESPGIQGGLFRRIT